MSYLREDVAAYRRSFGLPRFIACAITRICLRLLDPLAAVSYSQFGEDRILACLLPTRKPGSFVEVGANEPIRGSNTFALYKQGWRGVTIDANPEMIRRHRETRPFDRTVEALVSDQGEPLKFSEFDNPAFSRVAGDSLVTPKGVQLAGERFLQPRTLTSILDSVGMSNNFDLLVVDVEGHDLQVLQSLDWNRYWPSIVVVEMHSFRFGATRNCPEYGFLTGKGFVMVAYDGVNGYFKGSRRLPGEERETSP